MVKGAIVSPQFPCPATLKRPRAFRSASRGPILMRRKSFLFGFAILLLLAGAVAGLALLAKHEPDFYLQNFPPPGKERKRRSGQFVQDFNQFCQEVHANRVWSGRFDQECINSFFAEHFIESGLDERILPEGISAPRLVFEPERIRLAFRYGKGAFSTVIAIDLRIWLASRAPNVVVLELQSLHAGALPVAAQSLLERISETAGQNNINVTWYRHDGNPVALLRFQADQDRPTIKLEQLALHQGILEIQGRSSDAPSTPIVLPGDEKPAPTGQPLTEK